MTQEAKATEESPTPTERKNKPSEDFFWKAAGTAAGITAGLVGAASVLVLIIGLVASGALGDIFDQDQFGDRIDAINAVYHQGVKARQELNRSGTTLTNEAMCDDAYHRTGADHERGDVAESRKTVDGKPDLAFAELRRLSFINGCLGRPNNLPATPLPTPPSPSSSH